MRNKNLITMREAIFYRLYQNFKDPAKREAYIPVHEFMGEIFCDPLQKWGYVSYECSARCSEIIKENPELIQREMMTGKSGAHYYGYRMNPAATAEMIRDTDLKAFHAKIRI